jgi:predicted DNA-binding transcriptional regulator YafY
MPRKRAKVGKDRPGAISAGRAARLYRLLRLLRDGPKARDFLLSRLKIDVRGFYRDLEKLRRLGLSLKPHGQHYRLEGSFERAIARLPFPDPKLNLLEALRLAQGKTATHRKLRLLIGTITGRS